MHEDTSVIILTELRELRADLNSYTRASGERLARLERDNYVLMGNGQPGKIAELEKMVRRLQQWRWYLMGGAAGVSGVVSLVAWVLKH